MSQLRKLGSGTIWICKRCNTWWGSQIGKRPSTNFLSNLDKAGFLPSWDTYRGWILDDKLAPICLECGDHINTPALQSN